MGLDMTVLLQETNSLLAVMESFRSRLGKVSGMRVRTAEEVKQHLEVASSFSDLRPHVEGGEPIRPLGWKERMATYLRH